MNGVTSKVGEYVPEKMWNELSDSAKVERMRSEVKQLINANYALRMTIENLKNDLSNHDHLNGVVVKNIKTHQQDVFGASKLANPEAEMKGEVFF